MPFKFETNTSKIHECELEWGYYWVVAFSWAGETELITLHFLQQLNFRFGATSKRSALPCQQ